MLSLVNDEQRQLEADAGIRCEHLPLHQTEYIINKDGRKVCDECCDHSNEEVTGVYQWNGLTYCWLCCPHSFTGKDFVQDLDGIPTCTMCWVIVPNRSVRLPEYDLDETMLYSRRTKNTSNGNEGKEAEFDITTTTVKALKGLAKEYGVRGYSKYTKSTRGELEKLVCEAMIKCSEDETDKQTDETGELGKVEISDRTDDIVKYDQRSPDKGSTLSVNKSKVKPKPIETTKCEHKNIVMEFMTGDYCCSDCWDRVNKPSKEYGPVKFYPGSRCPNPLAWYL